MAQQADHRFPELWLRFREIQAVGSPGHANGAPNVGWLPPECPEGFETIRTLPWHIWTAGTSGQQNQITEASRAYRIDSSTLPAKIALYDTTSIFYSTELNNFLEVPYDCTEIHVGERMRAWDEDGWRRVTFACLEDERLSMRYPNLWMIGHGHLKTQIDANINDSWDNLLLPNCFLKGVQDRNTPPTCVLAGRLTMIIGAVAFATDRDDLIDFFRDSFRHRGSSHYLPPWRAHRQQDRGLIPKRGIIVDVAYDTTKYKKQDIEDWEEGHHGPILTSNAAWNHPQATRMPLQPGLRSH